MMCGIDEAIRAVREAGLPETIDGYNESLTIKGTAREIARKINYLEE